MSCRSLEPVVALAVGTLLLVFTSCSGSDGAAGPAGPRGPGGPSAYDMSTTPFSVLEQLDVVSEITGVTIASPPVVTFTLTTAEGVPIVGLVPYWLDSNRFVRFTITKLVAGTNGDPNTWVSYIRSNGEPTYDTGASIVDNDDGSYTFTFNTDIASVPGIAYEPTLTHRVAGQIGRYRTVPVTEQNVWLDFVPDGSAVSLTRDIAQVASCNECHDRLVFHGRRFEVEYCVQCHNPDLAEGEGNFAFMIHRIHNSGDFSVLEGGISYAELHYPQDVNNCRKCHNADDEGTPDADNWRNLPNMVACDGCHDVFGPNAANMHSGGVQTNNAQCVNCHSAASIAEKHATPNATPNNPELFPGQRNISYEMISASVDGSNNVITEFRILSGTDPLDVTNLPADLKDGTGAVFRYPVLLLPYAQAQGMVTEPADWNNLNREDAQPISIGLDDFSPINTTSPVGTLTFDSGTGVMTATVTDAGSQFPVGAMMRAVALQGYLRQDLDNDGVYDVSLHAISVVASVSGDAERRAIVDTTKCSSCHEWFEGHGGNRVFGPGSALVCTTCHVPNLSSSGRELAAFFTGPEDAQNFRDMIHGIHSSAFRTRDFTHVRNFRGGTLYNWSEVTFPAETNNCMLCHLEGSYELPLSESLLPTTVRTTGVANGLDPDPAAVTAARAGGALPNDTDWVNTPTASSCFYCHTSTSAWAHMTQNGAQLSVPEVGSGIVTNRSTLVAPFESCATCHGPGRTADLEVVHNH